MIRVASHVIGVTVTYLGAVYGISWLAEYLAGPTAGSVAASVAAIALFLPWLASLSLGKSP